MSSIRLVTPVPGPRTQALLARREQYVANGVSTSTPLFAARAEGALVEDVDGNMFLDFAGGIGVQNAGHNRKEVVQAIQEQSDLFLHTCCQVVMYDGYVQVAERLAQAVPGEGPKKALLLSTGAEAVENAVKIARKFTGRPAIIALQNAFHGRTLLGMSLTGKVNPYRNGFGPFAPEIYRAPFPYLYRMPQFGNDGEACARYCVDELERLILTEIGADRVAAVLVEPVQGEGGFTVAPPGYYRMLADICRKYGILLIADEIQTGFGRTGKMFAMEHYGVTADLTIVAKSLAAGMPLSAVVGRAEVMDSVHAGGLGGTYGGNPVACAAALAVLDLFADGELLQQGEALGQRIQAEFHRLAERYSLIGEVRALGPMAALELVQDRDSRKPAPAETEAVVQYCYQHGLILLKCGLHGNVIRFLAPLNITQAQLAEGIAVLEAALSAVSAERGYSK